MTDADVSRKICTCSHKKRPLHCLEHQDGSTDVIRKHSSEHRIYWSRRFYFGHMQELYARTPQQGGLMVSALVSGSSPVTCFNFYEMKVT